MNAYEYLVGGKERSGAPAMLTVQSEYSYRELCSAAVSVAAWLRERGAKRGDCVLLVAESSFFWAACYLGSLRAGVISVPLPANSKYEEIEFVRQQTNAAHVLASVTIAARNIDEFRRVALLTDRPLPQGLHLNTSDFDFIRRQMTPDRPSEKVSSDDVAALMFTSGSTGKPRGTMVSHGNIRANTESIVQYLSLTPADRIMAVLPLWYCFGTSLLHTHLRVGGSIVLDHRFPFPNAVLDHMIQRGCTGFAGVPSHYQILLRKSKLKKTAIPSLRYVQQAGGHLAPVFVEELREALPDAQVFVMYGQTEATARLSYLPPAQLERKLGSIGIAIPGVKLWIAREDGSAAAVREIGELIAEGGNVCKGYWQEPEETRRYFRNGRLHTGDLGYVDEDGFFYIVDRAKDFIKCGGTRVSSRKIEDQLLGCEGVLEVAVIGIPDSISGEAIKVVAVPTEKGMDLKPQIETFCRANFPPNLMPKEIEIIDAMPKNSSGKVLKAALKAAAAS